MTCHQARIAKFCQKLYSLTQLRLKLAERIFQHTESRFSITFERWQYQELQALNAVKQTLMSYHIDEVFLHSNVEVITFLEA